MNNNQDSFLTDEELEEVVGGFGKRYEYELIENNQKGNYYKCYIFKDGVQIGTTNVGVNKWDEFTKRLIKRGDTCVKR